MREIKFRAWDGKDMLNIDHWTLSMINWTLSMINQHIPENHIIMQYTGLKDKDKSESYAGDLYQININPEEKVLHQIVWLNRMACFALWPVPEDRGYLPPIYGREFADIIENNTPIGTIHTHPELIKK